MAAKLETEFLKNGYVHQPVYDSDSLRLISEQVFGLASAYVGTTFSGPPVDFFNSIHENIESERLNDLRMHIINGLLQSRSFHQNVFQCGKDAIEAIVGNELAIQRNMGFNIQLPGDDSSLLAPHSDVWGSECSPFECVMWLPLVNCFRTKSIFFLPPERDKYWRKQLSKFDSMDSIFEAIKEDVVWLDVPYGSFLLFTPTCLHGNRINQESETRWSFNIRFKGIFTPYAGKGFGDFFQPLSIKPISRIGMSFEFPHVGEDV
ncbi:MAG: sporadic carbohydrate cluster 2OG-Fe(II) oxygenase [Myxococcota bacterium]